MPYKDPATQANIQRWLEFDPASKGEIDRLAATDPKALTDAFYTTLSFGTAGLRGIMGVGTNRMNDLSVGMATQGLANYLKSFYGDVPLKVAIAYDSRHNSRSFAERTAGILAANGIHVLFYEALRPTPVLSFACRHGHCHAAVMITASHNPAIYNGYKVYWRDGGQVLPPHDQGIIDEVRAITTPSQIHDASLPHPNVKLIGAEMDEAYLDAIARLQLRPGGDLKIVYSPLNGTGITMVPRALERFGFRSVSYVEAQREPNGDFPTTPHPNPEDPAAMALGSAQLLQERGDIFIATDPDCDRMCVVVNDHGKAVMLNGNELLCLMADYICRKLQSEGRWPARAAFVRTIVTTPLFEVIVRHYGGHCVEVLTGFKYIAERIHAWEEGTFHYVYGGEESYGSLYGTHARDKDAVVSSCIIAEAAWEAKQAGHTLIDMLNDLYAQHGAYRERLITLEFEESKEGKEQMKRAMERIRKEAPAVIAGVPVVAVGDYLAQHIQRGETFEPTLLPPADVVLFQLQDGSSIYVRPSGTEPKVKIYLMVHRPTVGKSDELLQQLQTAMQELMKG